jgi:hypothetical protein
VKDKDIDVNRSTSSSDKTRQKTSDIECFKCGGHGHKKVKCPNHHVIIAIVDGAYDSQSEDEDAHDNTNSHGRHFETFEYKAEDGEHELGLNCLVQQSFMHAGGEKVKRNQYFDSMEEITCDDFEELLMETDSELCNIRSGKNHLSSNSSAHDSSLVVHRVLSTQLVVAEQGQRRNLFQSWCKVKGQVSRFIIDGGNYNNVVSATLVEKLGLQTHRHPHPYHMQWLNNPGIVKVTPWSDRYFLLVIIMMKLIVTLFPFKHATCSWVVHGNLMLMLHILVAQTSTHLYIKKRRWC